MAIKLNKVLLILTWLQFATLKQTICRVSFAKSVTIATQTGILMKNQVYRLLGNQNEEYASYDHFLKHFM